jgi:hypothetical protein
MMIIANVMKRENDGQQKFRRTTNPEIAAELVAGERQLENQCEDSGVKTETLIMELPPSS